MKTFEFILQVVICTNPSEHSRVTEVCVSLKARGKLVTSCFFLIVPYSSEVHILICLRDGVSVLLGCAYLFMFDGLSPDEFDSTCSLCLTIRIAPATSFITRNVTVNGRMGSTIEIDRKDAAYLVAMLIKLEVYS